MNVASVRKISARYHTKSGASAYLSIVCGLFLLCNCSNSSQLAMQEPPKCNIFNVLKGFGCVPTVDYMDNRLELSNEIVSKSEELKHTRSLLNTCQEHNKDITVELASCTGDYEKLNQTFNNVNGELSQLKNLYNFTQRDAYVRDAYVLAGGVALGVAGLWVCQKMLGITKRLELEKKVKTLEETIAATSESLRLELEKKVKTLEETIAATSESLIETDKTVGFVTTLELEKKVKTLEETIAATSESLIETDKTVDFVRIIALDARAKANQAIEASREATASRAGVPTHIIPQQENGG